MISITQNISARLRMLRNEAQLSQQEFANRIGVSKSSVNMYERGEREPSLETLECIADYFNVDMNYLLGKSDIRNSLIALQELKTTILSAKFQFQTILPLKNKSSPTIELR